MINSNYFIIIVKMLNRTLNRIQLYSSKAVLNWIRLYSDVLHEYSSFNNCIQMTPEVSPRDWTTRSRKTWRSRHSVSNVVIYCHLSKLSVGQTPVSTHTESAESKTRWIWCCYTLWPRVHDVAIPYIVFRNRNWFFSGPVPGTFALSFRWAGQASSYHKV